MRVLGLISMLVLGGCGASDDAPCNAHRADEVVADAVAIGVGAPAFVPLADGSEMELDFGTQGGWMIRPVLRIAPERLGVEDPACVWVEVVTAVDGLEELPTTTISVPFHEDGDHADSEPLLVLLAFDLEQVEGRSATITATVSGPVAQSTSVIAVDLVNRR